MAVCVGKVVPLLPSLTTSSMELSVAKVEGACQNSANCRKTQQNSYTHSARTHTYASQEKGKGGTQLLNTALSLPSQCLM